jgi:hypothetical protein
MKSSTQASKAERIILALLEHGSHEKAAAALGISAATIWRWLQKPEFQEQYRKARREAYSRGMGRLQHAVNPAVTTLLRIMVDIKAPPSSRIRAAVSVLDHANTFALEDLHVRIDSLEQVQKE